MTGRTLNHFALYRFTEAHVALDRAARAAFHQQLVADLRGAVTRVEVYQAFPARPDADLVVWAAAAAEDEGAPGDFFTAYARAVSPHRRFLQPVDSLWGMTRPSPYVGGKAPRGIDALGGKRQRYLTFYPFVKTSRWYLMSREVRQGMMNEHIKVGREYPEVDQLLLYSFGLQDQEFVVVYEMEDMARYSQLVADLRACEGRQYTERDTPITTAIYHPAEETLALWE
jgi:chlorite dismutase